MRHGGNSAHDEKVDRLIESKRRLALKEREITVITLACGHSERRITLAHGKQAIKCPDCGKETVAIIEINKQGEVVYFKVRESHA